MNVNTQKMEEYAEFLEENSRKIIVLCNKLEESLVMVVQCMDHRVVVVQHSVWHKTLRTLKTMFLSAMMQARD